MSGSRSSGPDRRPAVTAAATAAAARPRRGRRTDAETAEIRARVEVLRLQRYRSPAIHRALTGPENPTPIVISERQVRAHIKAVERSWLRRASAQTAAQDHANAVAAAEEAIRVAYQRSTIHAASTIGVGYFNAYLKGQERLARLLGLDGPIRTELSGPAGGPLSVELGPDWSDSLDPREEARRLRLRADGLEFAADPPAEPT